jgi:hypothetical protein
MHEFRVEKDYLALQADTSGNLILIIQKMLSVLNINSIRIISQFTYIFFFF